VELYLSGAGIDENVRQFFPLGNGIEPQSAGPYISGPIEFKPPQEIIGIERP
jgi:hypothetical protein